MKELPLFSKQLLQSKIPIPQLVNMEKAFPPGELQT